VSLGLLDLDPEYESRWPRRLRILTSQIDPRILLSHGFSNHIPAHPEFISLLDYKILLTRQLDGDTTTGQIEKRFTAKIFATRLRVPEAEGSVRAQKQRMAKRNRSA
jgi:hypothetical protein